MSATSEVIRDIGYLNQKHLSLDFVWKRVNLFNAPITHLFKNQFSSILLVMPKASSITFFLDFSTEIFYVFSVTSHTL
jgi:hypothetical protein